MPLNCWTWPCGVGASLAGCLDLGCVPAVSLFTLLVASVRAQTFHHVETAVWPWQEETDLSARPCWCWKCYRSEAKFQQTSPLYTGKGQKCGHEKGLLLCSCPHRAWPPDWQVDQNPTALLWERSQSKLSWTSYTKTRHTHTHTHTMSTVI